MNYFKKKESSIVFAYDDEQLSQANRLTELEILLQEKEPEFINAKQKSEVAFKELQNAEAQLQQVIHTNSNDNEATKDNAEIQKLIQLVEIKTVDYNEASIELTRIEQDYQPLKDEYDAIRPAFFDIRDNLKVSKKMTNKEIQAYINPPIPREQLIAEAEMQKQLCADEAEKNITILERKIRLGMAVDDDKDLLTAWEIYSVIIADIDTSTAPDITWPVKP